MTTKTIAAVGAALILTAVLSVQAYARGRCDGYHGCRCGVTAASYNGLPLNYNGFNLKRAIEYIEAFPRTTFGVGAVAYFSRGGPSGHVATVVGGSDCANATVHDDRGTYTRNVCRATFVAVHGGSMQVARAEHRYHTVRRRVPRNVQVASYSVPDRHSIH